MDVNAGKRGGVERVEKGVFKKKAADVQGEKVVLGLIRSKMENGGLFGTRGDAA